jgi:hypothetical protein
LTDFYQFDRKTACCGDVAQMGERGVRNAEVRGSIPLISTKSTNNPDWPEIKLPQRDNHKRKLIAKKKIKVNLQWAVRWSIMKPFDCAGKG